MPRSTGFPTADAEDDFQRARRRQIMMRLAQRLWREPDDVNFVLPFDEVVAALGPSGERDLGFQLVPIESIVGTVDRRRDFDRQFRPTSGRVRERWLRLAAAERRGEPIPPVSLYRVGDMHFVRDGHHRVSVAKALGRHHIEAHVVEVRTRLPASGIRFRGDLLVKDFQRQFTERVPLSPDHGHHLEVKDAWNWCVLSETVEAWGFRLIQQERRFLPRQEVAERWYHDEYERVVRMLRAADLIGDQTETEAYLRVAGERYRLIRTHEWSEEIIDRLRPSKEGRK